MSQAPSGILAGEAGDNRLRGADGDGPGPTRQGRISREMRRSQPAQADLGDTQAGRDTPRMRSPRIDQCSASRVGRHADAQLVRAIEERVEQASCVRVDADHIPTLARISAARLRSCARAWSALSASAITVHSGASLATGWPGGCRSAAQSGQKKPGLRRSAAGAYTTAAAAARSNTGGHAASSPRQAST